MIARRTNENDYVVPPIALLDDYEAYVADVMTENTFYFNKKGLVIIFNPYMVTAYAAGTIEVEVPYEELKNVMNEKYIL